MRKIIGEFRGKYGFLSNFYDCDVEFEGVLFHSSEAAFQAAKVKCGTAEETNKERYKFVDVTASESKHMGRTCKLREDWDTVKDNIMLEIVRSKFNSNKELAEMLIQTADAILIEGTKWHDNYWGNCTCSKCKNTQGLNILGNILMKVREELTMS